MQSQRDEVYEAEELAASGCCSDPLIGIGDAQTLVDGAIEWAKSTFGIRVDLTVTVEEEVFSGTSSEIAALWDEDPTAARVMGPLWKADSAQMCVVVYTMVATDSGYRVGLREHLLLHELAHVIVGIWPEVVDGKWSIGPDRHGPLFTRRHLDLLEHFHPACASHLEDAYGDLDVSVAAPNVSPATWWSLPRPSPEQFAAALGLADQFAAAVDGGGA